MHKAIFLDRDGILNNAILIDGKPYPPRTIKDVVISNGIVEKLSRLKEKGFLLIGVTNQPDVVRGDTTRKLVESINSYIKSELRLDALYVCYHDDKDNCLCRKPKPGLILNALKKYQISATLSYMVGDRWKDIEAGKRAGCKTIWVNNFYLEEYKSSEPSYTCANPADAFQWIITKESSND